MWKLLAFAVLVSGFVTKNFSLEIQINGKSSNKTVFCAGDNVTLFCSGGSGAYTWTIPMLSVNLGVTVGATTKSDAMNRFTAIRLSSTRSSLSFSVFMNLSNSNITCLDGANGSTLSTIEVEIFGPPSAPDVNIRAMSSSITLFVFPSGSSEACLKKFTANISSMNVFLDTQTVPASERRIIFERLNLNEKNYKIEVITTDFIGRTSEPYSDIVTISQGTSMKETMVSISLLNLRTDSSGKGGPSVGAIIGIVIAIVVDVIILPLILIITLISYQCIHNNGLFSTSNIKTEGQHSFSQISTSSSKSVDVQENQGPLYQNPKTIQDEPSDPSCDLYSLPQSQGKLQKFKKDKMISVI